MSSPLLDLYGLPPVVDPQEFLTEDPNNSDNPQAQTYQRQKPIRVLALGGGRTVGLSSLRFLEELVKRVAVFRGLPAGTDVRPCDCFDLIIGTGTGGLSALFLGRMRMTVRQAIQQYIRVVYLSFETPWIPVTSMLEWPEIVCSDELFDLYVGDIIERHLGNSDAGLGSDPEGCQTAIIVSDGAAHDATLTTFQSFTAHINPSISYVARETLSRTSELFNLSGIPAIDEADMLAELGLIAARILSPESGAGCFVSLGTSPRAGASPINADDDRDLRSQQLRDHSGNVVPYFRFNINHGLRMGYSLQWENLELNIPDMNAYMQKDTVNAGLESSVSLLCVDAPFSRSSSLCLDGKISNKSTYAVASGGYADIWTGSLENRTVAIKTMRPFSDMGGAIEIDKLRKRLWREYVGWSKLSHPNILDCLGYSYDFTPQSDHKIPSLISPWMSNGTVLAYIGRHPNADRLRIVAGIARGLVYLHTRRPAIVHGDIRAGNVLVSDAGNPCLADFGLSRMISETHAMTTSSAGGVAGSLRWMAPELFHDERQSLESDVWAYGMTVLEIFTGKRPFDELRLEPLALNKILNGQFPARPLPSVFPSFTDDIWMICLDCWSQQPEWRPPMVDVLVEIESGLVNGLRLN